MQYRTTMKCLLSVLFLSLVTFGCESARWRSTPRGSDYLERCALSAARDLDVIARDLDEYGSITASAVAPLQPSDRFGFDLDLTPRQMFERNAVQGQSTIRRFEELAVRLSARYAASVPVPEETDASATLDNQAAPDLPPEPGRATPDKFTDSYETPDASVLDIPLRDLIKRVSDDHMTLKLLEWMSNPDTDGFGSGKLLYMSVLSVNVRPGRMTYEGYQGEIDIRFDFWDKNCEKRVTDRTPEAFAVFPAVDSHVLDLRTSIREQFALAVMLEAAFPTVGGQLAADYLERLEQDAASHTVSNTVVGYTAGGNHIGWRFSPAFTAQADPSDIPTGPSGQLQAQSFPALVLLVCDKSDIAKKLDGSQEQNDGYEMIHMSFSPRWLRAPSPKADRKGTLFGELHRLHHPRLSETVVVDWAIRLDRARNKIDELKEKAKSVHCKTKGQGRDAEETASSAGDTDGKDGSREAVQIHEVKAADGNVQRAASYHINATPQGGIGGDASDGQSETTGGVPVAKPHLEIVQTLSRRYNMLRAHSVGQPYYLSLPVRKKPQQAPLAISGIEPRQGWIDRDSYFVVRGRGFTPETEFYIGGVKADIVGAAISVSGNAAVVKVAEGAFRQSRLGAQDVAAFRKGRLPAQAQRSEECKKKSEKGEQDDKGEPGASAYLHDTVEFTLRNEPAEQDLTERFKVEWAGEPGSSKITSIRVHPEHQIDVIKLIEALMHRNLDDEGGDTVDIEIDVDANESASK